MNDTAISWTHRPGTRGKTWNPVRGCRNKSEGCRNCYAKAQAARIIRMGKGKPTPYDGLVRVVGGEPQWTGEIALDAARLADPLRWREPSTVFVDSMADLFYDARPDEHIAAVFGVMAACPQHTFIVLTKYTERARRWFDWLRGPSEDTFTMRQRGICAAPNTSRALLDAAYEYLGKARKPELDAAWRSPAIENDPWPLSNVWLGVSVENRDALHRLDDLRAIPSMVRMVSAEPLLEDLGTVDLRGIGWWIVGCESGPGARPCGVEWLRSMRDQCAEAGVPFFLKQAVADVPTTRAVYPSKHAARVEVPAAITPGPGSRRKPGGVIELPYLDGIKHAAFPEVP